jgi:hypothetical protein
MCFFKEPDPEKLVKEYFSFLVEQYGFTYTPYCFTSKKIKIIIQIGRVTPTILVAYVGEPDITNLNFYSIREYFEDKGPYITYSDHSLAYNLKFMARILKGYMSKIIDHMDEWWIPIHKSLYEHLEKEYKESGQMDDFIETYKRDYDYLKSKGAV